MEKVFAMVEEKMGKTVSVLSAEFASIRAGRANSAVLDKIKVDYYGTPTPINQMAAVSVAEARILTIQPWDVSTLHPIEKAIQASDIGINPQNDGRIIRLVFPQLTEERRKELCKDVKKLAEDSRIAVRSIRRDGIDKVKKMEKASEITEDDLKIAEKKLQDLTDKYIKNIDKLADEKEKEIMAI
ncbi:ribosome recycling factor [Clostridium sp. CAG:413]|jgi:ribosome recycling factor|nr:ribosome recycling factor [Clostridium sp.]CDC11534.1 ribosome recycling factor [Clostridium sp. CAG:413]